MLKKTANGSAAELIAGGFAILCLLIGGVQRSFDPQNRWMDLLTRPAHSEMADKKKLDIVLPNSVIAASCLAGLIAASVGGCYLYYPPHSEIHKEMTIINTELHSAAMTGDWEGVEHWIPIQEDWAHKLNVSSYLRRTPMSRFQQLRLKVYLTKLELLEHASEDQEREEAKDWARQMALSFRRLFLSLNALR